MVSVNNTIKDNIEQMEQSLKNSILIYRYIIN